MLCPICQFPYRLSQLKQARDLYISKVTCHMCKSEVDICLSIVKPSPLTKEQIEAIKNKPT